MTVAHRAWMLLAAEEYRRVDTVIGDLSPAQWRAETDCTGWTVRDIVAHLVGAAEATASVREQLRQQRLGTRSRAGGLQIDAVNALQVAERSHLSPDDLRHALADAARRSVRARARTPAPVRALRLPFPPPVGWASLGRLNDVVYTRDAWMHRIDLCRATGTPLELTAEHDGRIVADAAREWLRATGTRTLVLTGPASQVLTTDGARPARGDGATDDAVTYDAVDFARALSGRGKLPGVRPDVVLF